MNCAPLTSLEVNPAFGTAGQVYPAQSRASLFHSERNHSLHYSNGSPLTRRRSGSYGGQAAHLSRSERDRSLTKAFTLLEVLLAVVLVTIMVLLISNLFRQVSGVWNIGTQMADMNTAARAAMDFMASELEQAVAGPIDSAEHPGYSMAFKLEPSANWPLRFLTLTHDPGYDNGYYRALRAVYFQLNSETHSLEYARKTGVSLAADDGGLDCYYAPVISSAITNWVSTMSLNSFALITNVFDFQVCAYATPADVASGNGQSSYDSTELPYCVDLYLEVLGNDDARKATSLSGANLNNFLDRNGRRYTTRVYFNNREGYRPR